MTTKIYAARDSATSALRKLGIQARDYNFFITKVGDKFECKLGAAAAHLESLKNPKPINREEVDLRSKIMAEDPNSDLDDCSIDDLREIAAKLGLTKSTSKSNRAAKAPKTVKPAAETRSISSVARAMILDGKTNQEVWAAIKEQFNLDDSKKHYPTWYRCEMSRKGLLPK